MFEFRQDTALIQGAFLSAQRCIQLEAEVPDRNLCTLSDDEVCFVTKLVTEAVALAKRGSWASEWEKPDALLADIRAHATVFYTVLRSAGITCGAADKYYSALADIFPPMDWSVYIALLKSCDWWVFFLECINDIPGDASSYILESMLTQIRNTKKSHDCCIMSTMLEAVMWKLLGFKLKPKHETLGEDPPKFCFPFDYIPSNSLFPIKRTVHPITDGEIYQELISDTETASEISKPLTFSDLLSDALEFSTGESNDTEVLKVLLRGLVTLLDVCIQMKPKDIPYKFDLVAPLIYGALSRIQSKKYAEQIFSSSLKFSSASIKKELVCNYLGWDVDIAYLSFLLCGGWKELSYYLQDHKRTVQDCVSRVNATVEILCELLPLNTEDPSRKGQFLDALIFVADNKLIGINYTLALFIGHPDFLEREDVIACLERNMPQPADRSLVYSLLNVIMEQSVSAKDRLIPIFFQAAKSLSVLEQQCMLQDFLLTYGLNENLKLPNFAKEMSPILNQTVHVEQAEKEIVLLCLQSPKECISIIVQQAVRGNSGQIAVLVKMLKLLSSVCAFRKSQKASLLVNELKLYFSSSSLTSQQLKNIKLMIEELLQVLDDCDGLKPSELVMECVLPYIELDLSPALISFPLEILEIILSTTISAKRTSWINDICVPVFIIHIGRMIEFSIFHKSGSLKERVVSVLDLFYELQLLEEDRNLCTPVSKGSDLWIQNYLSGKNPLVSFYIEKCIARYTSLKHLNADISHSLDIMWISSCIYGRRLESPMKEFILKNCTPPSDSTFLVMFLSRVLPHLTLKEWHHSALLIEDCLEFLSLNSHLEQPALTDRNLRLPISVEIFVDALILLCACSGISLDWSYMVSSFAKVISNLVSSHVEELHFETLTMLFLELCRLASHLEEVHLELITVPLLDILKILKKFPCFTDGTSGLSTCVYAAAHALPDYITRSNVLGSLKA